MYFCPPKSFHPCLEVPAALGISDLSKHKYIPRSLTSSGNWLALLCPGTPHPLSFTEEKRASKGAPECKLECHAKCNQTQSYFIRHPTLVVSTYFFKREHNFRARVVSHVHCSDYFKHLSLLFSNCWQSSGLGEARWGVVGVMVGGAETWMPSPMAPCEVRHRPEDTAQCIHLNWRKKVDSF